MQADNDRLKVKFEDLKKTLSERAAASLGTAGLRLFLTLLDGYHEELTQSMNAQEKKVDSVTEENNLLRGLLGADETGILAKLVSQDEEIRFLRKELLGQRKSAVESTKKKEAMAVEIERLKKELSTSFREREKDQMGFDKRVESLSATLAGYDEKTKSWQKELLSKKDEYDRKLADVALEVEKQSEEAVKRAVVRLNNICREIEEASVDFKGEIEKLKTAQKAAVKQKKTIFAKQPVLAGNLIDPILPSFNLLCERVEEGAVILKKYMEIFAPPELKAEKVNWGKLFDDLKGRLGPKAAAKRISLKWPAGKMPADMICDQNLLMKSIAAVILNSIEALPVEGEITVEALFSKDGGEVVVSDNGKEIATDNREMLFVPLFTTKTNHFGLGLVNCRRSLRLLGGDAVYEPRKGWNAFKLSFRAIENRKIKK